MNTENPNPKESLSQNDIILAHLKDGHSLTPMDAFHLCGCWALSSRISDLRKQGHNIKSELIKLENGKKVSRYSLIMPEPMSYDDAMDKIVEDAADVHFSGLVKQAESISWDADYDKNNMNPTVLNGGLYDLMNQPIEKPLNELFK